MCVDIYKQVLHLHGLSFIPYSMLTGQKYFKVLYTGMCLSQFNNEEGPFPDDNIKRTVTNNAAAASTHVNVAVDERPGSGYGLHWAGGACWLPAFPEVIVTSFLSVFTT